MRLLVATFLCFALNAQAQTREEWIALGEKVHGGFGAFIPLGIRIGQDALRRLEAAAQSADAKLVADIGAEIAVEHPRVIAVLQEKLST